MNDQSDRQYLCLVYHDDAKLEALSQRDMDALVSECVDWIDGLERNGRHIYSAGLQSIRALSVRQYPRSDIAVVRVSTVYVSANADLVRGFITTPLERVIASADGIEENAIRHRPVKQIAPR